jgi:hypothetical protein
MVVATRMRFMADFSKHVWSLLTPFVVVFHLTFIITDMLCDKSVSELTNSVVVKRNKSGMNLVPPTMSICLCHLK